MRAVTYGLTRVQLEREIERIIAKQRRGEKLTLREERILVYGRAPECRCRA